MVNNIPFLRDAAELVYAHQENFDGSGYPRGLRGEAIPLGARIFAIADTLDAITSDRPYRKCLSFAQAREEIARCAGSQFDPQIVQVFLGLPLELWSDLRKQVEHAPVRHLRRHPVERHVRQWRRPRGCARSTARLTIALQSLPEEPDPMPSSKQKLSEQQLRDLLIELPEWAAGRRQARPRLDAAHLRRGHRLRQPRGPASPKRPSTTPTSTSATTCVKLALVSHDAGGITERDAEMARRLSAAFPTSSA